MLLLSLHFAPFTRDGKICISDYLKVLVFSRLVEKENEWGKLHATWCFQRDLRTLQWEILEGNHKQLQEIYNFVQGRLSELEHLIYENPVGVIGVLLEDTQKRRM